MGLGVDESSGAAMPVRREFLLLCWVRRRAAQICSDSAAAKVYQMVVVLQRSPIQLASSRDLSNDPRSACAFVTSTSKGMPHVCVGVGGTLAKKDLRRKIVASLRASLF